MWCLVTRGLSLWYAFSVGFGLRFVFTFACYVVGWMLCGWSFVSVVGFWGCISGACACYYLLLLVTCGFGLICCCFGGRCSICFGCRGCWVMAILCLVVARLLVGCLWLFGVLIVLVCLFYWCGLELVLFWIVVVRWF